MPTSSKSGTSARVENANPKASTLAYQCDCGCVHGWVQHSAVTLIKRHERWPSEDIWWCPSCGAQHRTTDGTMLGQTFKRYKQIDPDDEEAMMLARFSRCRADDPFMRIMMRRPKALRVSHAK
jgi:hypothetical protein